MALTVEFSVAGQSGDALRGAAYRLIGIATCKIDQKDDRWVCELNPVPAPHGKAALSLEQVETRFLDLVTDENLRERIAGRTDRVRDVIIALAFGSIAATAQGSAE